MVHTLPTATISLNSKQRDLIKAGLDVLVARHGGALLGHFPHRHPWHYVDPHASNIYCGKVYNAMMAGAFISLRAKLSHAANHRINANAFEIAAAAFVVRITREKRLEEQYGSFQVTADGPSALNFPFLEQKLEVTRRRARHAAIKEIGEVTYDGLWKTWDRFLQWIRYFLLYGPQYISSFRLMRKPGIRMHIWKYQRDEITALAQRVIERRSDTKVAADVVRKNVDLAISELRRGRYPGLTVMTVIHEQRLGADFMFDFLSARVDLEPLKPVTHWYERALSPVEKFAALQNPATTTAPPTSEQTSESSGLAPSSSVVVQQSSPAALATVSTALPPFGTAIPFTAEGVADAVAKWLRDWIPQRIWEPVIDQARFLVIRRPAEFLPPFTSAMSLEELIDLCRPKQKLPDPWEDAGAAPEELNYLVDWLLGWLSALKSDVVPWSAFAWQTYGILRAGFGRAKKSLAAKA